MAGAIGALTSLDFLNLGMPLGAPSLGELLSQGKDNLYAWWISVSTFAVLVVMLLLLILIGDALREPLHPRQARAAEGAAPSVDEQDPQHAPHAAHAEGRPGEPPRRQPGHTVHAK